MNFKQLMAGFEAAVPAVSQVVVAMHPENALEGAKIAAGVQLFQFLCAGLHQIAAASAGAETPAAAAAPAPVAPSTVTPAAVTPAALATAAVATTFPTMSGAAANTALVQPAAPTV